MAERRMFAKTIVTSDSFLDMPLGSRCLYFSLGMVADDDGFINNPKSVMRQIGATIDDLNVLIAKRFVLTFPSGIVVIKHWKINNYIAKDRYKETKYLEEKRLISVDQNGAYTECIQPVYKMDTQVRLGEVRLGEDRLGEREDETPPPQTNPDSIILGKYNNVVLTNCERDKLMQTFPNHWEDRIEKFSEYLYESGKKYAHHFSKIMRWAKEDKVPTYSDKADKSYDLDDFFEKAVSNGRK